MQMSRKIAHVPRPTPRRTVLGMPSGPSDALPGDRKAWRTWATSVRQSRSLQSRAEDPFPLRGQRLHGGQAAQYRRDDAIGQRACKQRVLPRLSSGGSAAALASASSRTSCSCESQSRCLPPAGSPLRNAPSARRSRHNNAGSSCAPRSGRAEAGASRRGERPCSRRASRRHRMSTAHPKQPRRITPACRVLRNVPHDHRASGAGKTSRYTGAWSESGADRHCNATPQGRAR